MILRIIYTFFIGIFLALFVGVGIAAFYPGPKALEIPALLKYCQAEITQTSEKFSDFKSQAQLFDASEKRYQQAMQVYNRNVSILAVSAAVMIVIISLTLFQRILLLADGLLLGGVLTLLYGVIRGFNTEDNMFRFIVVTIGLIVSLGLGYLKFIKPTQEGVHL